MRQYINPNHNTSSFSISHNLNIIYKKIEFILYIFLCITLFVASKLENESLKKIENIFLEISLPISRIITLPLDSIASAAILIKDLAIAHEENKKLKAEISQLKYFYLKSSNIYQENLELRRALNFISTKSSEFKVARIIGKSKQIFNQKIYLNIGHNRQVKEGNIVIGNSGVIGRVSEIFYDKSKILLLNDIRSRIPVITSEARVKGILAGTNNDLLEMLYLPKDHNIKVGDKVFTSGDGDTIAPGHFIGLVIESNKNKVLVSMTDNINYSDIVTVINYDS